MRGSGPLRVSGMEQVARKVRPGVDLHQEFTECHTRQALGDVLGQGLRACRPWVGLERREDDLVIFDPDVAVRAGEQLLDLGHGAVQLGFAFFQAPQPLAGRAGLAHHLRPPARPLLGGNEIGVRIGIPSTVRDPDIARAQGTAQGPPRAELVIPAADSPILLPDVGAPRVGHQGHRGLCGDWAARWGTIECPDDLDGRQHRVIGALGVKGEGLEKRRRKLPDGAIAGPKEVDGIILARPNQPRRLFDSRPEHRFRDARKTDRPDGGIVNRGVEQHLSQFPEEPELLIGRAGDRLA